MLTRIDVNVREQPLGHIDARRLCSQQLSEARNASEYCRELLKLTNHPQVESASFQRTSLGVVVDLKTKTGDQAPAFVIPTEMVEAIDYALSDPNISIDEFGNEMFVFDLIEDAMSGGGSDQITGFLRQPGDVSPLVSPRPGDVGSDFDGYDQWRLDKLVTMMTGIDPQHGDVILDTQKSKDLLEREDFMRVITHTGADSLPPNAERTKPNSGPADRNLMEIIPVILEALDNQPDEPTVDEQVPPPPRHECYPNLNRLGHMLPPPEPEDCTPPGAVRPRPCKPGPMPRGNEMFMGTIYDDDVRPASGWIDETVDGPVERAHVAALKDLMKKISNA